MGELLTQSADSIWEEIVDDVLTFWMQLMQKKFDLVTDSGVWVLQQHANVYDFSFDLKHIIENQMCDHHKSLSSHMVLFIVKKSKDLVCFFVQAVWESIEKITKWNNNVCFDSKIDLGMKNAENKL